jgi:hypothetical protein
MFELRPTRQKRPIDFPGELAPHLNIEEGIRFPLIVSWVHYAGSRTAWEEGLSDVYLNLD